jgi:ATP-dependent exoDNAse (exonuclease V) beta subunit
VVEWRASSGAVHRFRVIRRSDVELRNSNRVNVEASNPESRIPNPDVVSLEALVDSAPERVSVASIVSPDAGRFGSHRTAAASGRLAGTLVHRLLQRIGIQDPGAGTREEQRVREMALRLVRAQEVDEHDDVQHIVDAAVGAYHSICARDDIRVLYQTGRALHEVPFTMSIDGRVVRGTIDCLVETAPGAFTVLEFKTGRERAEDREQVQLYLQALKHVFPGASIEARVVYTARRSGDAV